MVFTRKPWGFSTGHVSLPEGTLHGRPLFQVFPSLGIFGGGFHSKKEMYFFSQKPNTVLKKNKITSTNLILGVACFFMKGIVLNNILFSMFQLFRHFLVCQCNLIAIKTNSSFLQTTTSPPPPHRTKAGFFVGAAWKIFSISSREPSS